MLRRPVQAHDPRAFRALRVDHEAVGRHRPLQATGRLALCLQVLEAPVTEDVAPNRLERAKSDIRDLVERLAGDRVGLIVFGSAAFVQAPFTEDLHVCRILLEELQVRMAGPQTKLGDAVGLALTVFERSDVKERVLIVLTDGNDTGSQVHRTKQQ